MSKEQFSLRVRYEYEADEELALKYTHGVWGGINPHGEIELNFYTESDKLPSHTERIISSDGVFGHEMMHNADQSVKVVTRNVHTKLLFSYHTARAVIDWLEEKIEVLESDGDMDDEMNYGNGEDLKQ